jgi:peroxiredoxin
MNKIMKTIPVLCVSLALFAVSCSSGGPSAKLGMSAPPLQIAHWVKGTPLDLSAVQRQSVVVVEFWATWCPPCRTSIPHLSSLQKRFKDRGVIIVGISDETVERVKPFVDQMGDEMDYLVAIDDRDKTFGTYMRAFGVDGIPHAFVVGKDGRIAWHGHPMDGLDRAIEKALQGSPGTVAKE